MYCLKLVLLVQKPERNTVIWRQCKVDDKLVIRRAAEEDKAVVFRLYQELDNAYEQVTSDEREHQDKRWKEVLGDERQHILLAEKNGQVVGALNLVVVPNLGHQGQPWAAVTNVVVDAKYRGQGIGKQLLAKAGDIAREQRCYKIVLSSNIARKDAHDFYRHLGWQQSHIGFCLPLD
jgi:GNAT superfamily N-acetyltransferase